MFFNLFLTGLIIGVAVSIPLGPIGVLIIQRTVNKDRTAGFLSGMGAATSDAIYAIIAGFSLTWIINFIRQYQLTFQTLGALIIMLLGVHIFLKNPVKDIRRLRRKGSSYFQDFVSTFLITFPNPLVIFVFLAVFASTGIVLNLDTPYQSFVIVFGVFSGACSWWLLLTGLVSLFKHRFNLRLLWWFNKIAGVLIWIFVIISYTYSLFNQLKI
ncbi:LysE family transporter [uncultured Sunxiuqinia sp.]|uniref:LysE family translocator n=1 Tax=uncultured Sunxiuqinia sp. TaxID=1573825 RepID=UPI0030DCB8F9|tara:strand:+ start:3031 stop:3669 length:639 start_codon:yes stop_codon:yes gene_type:complete